MSQKREGRAGRDMTRSEFLGVGLTAGAAAAYGPAAGGLAESSASHREPTRQVAQCGQAQPLRWAIAMRHLSALWSDLIPRVVAAAWAGDALGVQCSPDPVPALPDFYDPGNPGKTINDRIAKWIKWVLETTVSGATIGSPLFRQRMVMLQGYWASDRVPPVRYRADGGFDFYVSDEGIDLYFPTFSQGSRNSTLEQLLFYFTIRETGRPVLGTPGVRSDYIMPAKTGASQLEALDPDTVLQIVNQLSRFGTIAPENVCGYRRGVLRKLDALFRPVEVSVAREHGATGIDHQDVPTPADRDREVLARRVVKDAVIAGPGGQLPLIVPLVERAWNAWEIASQVGTGDNGDLPAQRRSWWPAPRAAVAEILGNDPEGCSIVTDDDVMCLEVANRCWQLEGSVLRGIAEQHPRVVAQAWFEAMEPNGQFPTMPLPIDFIRYREAMKDRLETALPDKMFFDVDDAAMRPSSEDWFKVIMGLENPPSWDGRPGELTVSNQGLHFPVVTPPGWTATGTSDPTTGFLKEVLMGRAGNPVFTDSRHSL